MAEDNETVTPNPQEPPAPAPTPPAPPAPDPGLAAKLAAADKKAAEAEAHAQQLAAKQKLEAERLAAVPDVEAQLKRWGEKEALLDAAVRRVEASEQAAQDAARVRYLRDQHVSATLSDINLLALAPDVDISTADGKAAIDAWREANIGLFGRAPDTAETVRQSITAMIPDAPKRPLFGDDFRQQVMQSVFGGGES